jgi:THAP4-like, heme-binding beta-barrel domain
MKKLLFFLLIFPSILHAQLTKKDSAWLPLQPFIGSWSGNGDGEPGIGKYERTYQFILGKNFIEIRNKSTYPPSAGNSQKGEVHEDIGYFSYDKSRKKFKLRQFHAEGFVNEYMLDSISPDKKTIVFITEAIENIPAGWLAKETYHLLNENEIEETFELAEPGKSFQVYTKVKLVKQQ